MATVISTALYPVALNSHQDLVTAISAKKGQDYFCIECNEKMIARQGEIRVEHFAHHVNTGNCNAESALHKSGKAMIKQMIEDGIERGNKILVKPHCKVCKRLNKIDNFPIGWDSVAVEYSLKLPDRLIRPDIVVFKNNNPSLLIEVVVTHYPDDDVIESLKKYLKQDDSPDLSLLVVPINCHSPLFSDEPYIEGYLELSSDDCPHCKEVAEQKEKERQAWEEKEKIRKILEESMAREKREYNLREGRKNRIWRDLYFFASSKNVYRETGAIEIVSCDFNYKILRAVELKHDDLLYLYVYDLRDLSFDELQDWLHTGSLPVYDDPRCKVMAWRNVFDAREVADSKELVLNHAYSSSPGDPLENICRKLLLKESSIYSANIK